MVKYVNADGFEFEVKEGSVQENAIKQNDDFKKVKVAETKKASK